MREFCAKLNEWTNISQSIMIAGRTADGRPYCSRATRLILEAVDANRLLNPALGVACCEGMDEGIWDRSVAMIADGFSQPALFNDVTITRAFVQAGVPAEHACEAVHSTCTEMTIPGRGGIQVVAGKVNLPKALEFIWYRGRDREGAEGGVDTGELRELEEFEDFVCATQEQLRCMIRSEAAEKNRKAWCRMRYDPKPFSSCLIDDCVARGRDMACGGALYSFSYMHGLGLPNLVDSLLAIKTLVYDQKRMSLEELRSVLEADYEGHEPLRREIIGKLPKCGTDSDEADALAGRLYEFCCDEISRYRTPLSRYVPGFLAARTHIDAGRRCMATPDGRKAGTPLADSLVATQGRASRGPTALLNSAAKHDLRRALGGAVVNLHLTPSALQGADARRKFTDLVRAHFADGGFQVQVTVTSAETLERAQRRPEEYEDLFVRVGGYSDYFTHLDHAVQNAIIDRARSGR